MNFLIPKDARKVKTQIFKAFSLLEIVMMAIGIIIIVLIFQTKANIFLKLIISFLIFILEVFLVSPSFISNKKGYETFQIIFRYLSTHNKFEKKAKIDIQAPIETKKGKKNVK